MSAEPPIACSLSAGQMTARQAEMAAIGRRSLLHASRSDGRARLRFHDEPAIRRRLAAIVAAESECCPFLTMSLGHGPAAITLAIDGPAGAEPVIDRLVQAFAG